MFLFLVFLFVVTSIKSSVDYRAALIFLLLGLFKFSVRFLFLTPKLFLTKLKR